MDHNDLTIVSVYGHNTGSTAIPSILKSMQELPGSRGLLLSYNKPVDLPSDIEWQRIEHTNYMEYSPFMMHCLQSFIKTEYCLVVQDDGWVLNGNNFKSNYYDYDYIGAPSHCGLVGNQFLLQFGWVMHPERRVVQNGGFSLRSKRLLSIMNEKGLIHRYATEIHSWNEDAQYTAILRPTLEDWGIKYAPENIAKNFSIEYVGPIYHDSFDYSVLVGHHAQTRQLVGDMHIKMKVSNEEVDRMYGERQFLNYLQSIGYTIEPRHT